MSKNGKSDDANLDFQAQTLAGDVRDRVLGHLRGWRKAIHELSEEQQVGLARELEQWAADVVRMAVLTVGARRLDAMPVAVKGATLKVSTVELKLTLTRDEELALTAASYTGREAVLVLADYHEYMGERATVAIDPDQPALDLGGKKPSDGLDGDTMSDIARQWAEDDAEAAAPDRGKKGLSMPPAADA